MQRRFPVVVDSVDVELSRFQNDVNQFRRFCILRCCVKCIRILHFAWLMSTPVSINLRTLWTSESSIADLIIRAHDDICSTGHRNVLVPNVDISSIGKYPISSSSLFDNILIWFFRLFFISVNKNNKNYPNQQIQNSLNERHMLLKKRWFSFSR